MSDPLTLVTRPEQAAADVIKYLTKMLDMANRGQIVSVGIAYVADDGAIGATFSRSDLGGLLIGASALLTHRLCRND